MTTAIYHRHGGLCPGKSCGRPERMHIEREIPDPIQVEDSEVEQSKDADVSSIQKDFEDFHRANPNVYDLVVRFARLLQSNGHSRAGIRMIWERVRWEILVTTTDANSDFKLNDHYHSRYARLVMEQEPDLDGFFSLRRLRS